MRRRWFSSRTHSQCSRVLEQLEGAVAALERGSIGAAAYDDLLRKCGDCRSVHLGGRVHSHIIGSGRLSTFLQNQLVQMYGKCGDMEQARSIFTSIARKNTFSFNMLISAAARNNLQREAIALFQRMIREGVLPDKFTYTEIFNCCCSVGDLDAGRSAHSGLESSGVDPDDYLRVALLNMYAKLGALSDAERIFASLRGGAGVVPWNVMIAAFSHRGSPRISLDLFRDLLLQGIFPDLCTLISVLSAISSLRLLRHGRIIHELITVHGFGVGDTVLETAILDMYGKCGSVVEARSVFDRMKIRDIVSWNSMISAYSQHGSGQEALNLFIRMEKEGFQPELVTFVSLLAACCSLGDLSMGKSIHQRLLNDRFDLNLVAENAIVNMYSKCGSIDLANAAFAGMTVRDVVSWNAIIAANAENGDFSAAVHLCMEMALDGVEANETTLTCALLCCSHGGMLEEGLNRFRWMVSDYEIAVEQVHFQSVVDLLARGGWIDEAEEVMDLMPFQPGLAGWRAYLGACKTHVTEPGSGVQLVLLSNIDSTLVPNTM